MTQPAVVYDPVGKRFIAVAITNDGGDIGLAMRVSKGTAAAPLTNKKWRSTVFFGSQPSGGRDTWRARTSTSGTRKLGVTATRSSSPRWPMTPTRRHDRKPHLLLAEGGLLRGQRAGRVGRRPEQHLQRAVARGERVEAGERVRRDPGRRTTSR